MVPSSPTSPTGTPVPYPPTGYLSPMSPQQLTYPQTQGMPQQVYYAPAGWAYGQFPYQPTGPGGVAFSPTGQPNSPTTFMTMPNAYPSPSAETTSPPPFWGGVDGSGAVPPTTSADGTTQGGSEGEDVGRLQQQQAQMGYPPFVQGGYVPVQGGYAFVAPGGYMTPTAYLPQAGMVQPQQQQPQPPMPTSPTAQTGESA